MDAVEEEEITGVHCGAELLDEAGDPKVCGQLIPAGANFCPSCGRALNSNQRRASNSQLRAVRRRSSLTAPAFGQVIRDLIAKLEPHQATPRAQKFIASGKMLLQVLEGNNVGDQDRTDAAATLVDWNRAVLEFLLVRR